MKRLLGLLVLMTGISSAAVLPTVTITYTGLAGTPAPGTLILMALGLLITFIAFRKMSNLSVGRPLAAILLLAGLSLFEAMTGHQLITKASAIAVIPTESITGGGNLMFTLSDGSEAFVQNNTGLPQQITSISVTSPNTFITPGLTPQCQVGTVLAPGAGCYVEIAGIA
jgi:hypothetical protein